MNNLITGLLTSAVLGLTTLSAQAGGIERSAQSVAALFEQGRYIEFSFATVSPTVSGTQLLVSPPSVTGSQSGDISPSYQQYGFAYKADIDERLSYAVIYDQPYGADVDYPTGTGYFAGGSSASFDSHALTGILR